MNYLIIFFTFLFLNTPSESNDLTLTISNIKDIEGTLEIGIYNDGEFFMEKGKTFRTASVEVTKSSETIVIRDLPHGTYAISMYHDINSNDKCDRNFFGIPEEPYAFSNNFKPRFSKPTFEDCEFNISSDHSMEINLIH